MSVQLNLHSLRAKKARLSRLLGETGYKLIVTLIIAFAASGITMVYLEVSTRIGYIFFGLGLGLLCLAAWYSKELKNLPPQGTDLGGRVSVDVLGYLKLNQQLTPSSLWKILVKNWQGFFFTNHLLLTRNDIATYLSDSSNDVEAIWAKSVEIANYFNNNLIEPAYIVSAILLTDSIKQNILTPMKLTEADIQAITMWIDRFLKSSKDEKPYFGGIGRDWAHGFTPTLNEFGYNVSADVEKMVTGYYSWLTTSPGVTAMKNAFAQGANAIALVGPNGVGKTSHVFALAQLLLSEEQNPHLEHRQIIALDSSTILSHAKGQGELEELVSTFMYEASKSGNVIIFLDNAELFFNEGVGSFDVTHILLPILESRNVQLIMAMTPGDFQRLKSIHSGFASLLTPVHLNELDEQGVLRVLEDTSIGLEANQKVLISYQALKEAYRLSGRYEQDVAYPGKAINLLKLSLSYAISGVVTIESVQHAVEETRGVKVGTAAPAEAERLLHLEDDIHKRMINQTRAVSVVASALRRARAGVANPKRPIGSFLFLGPTGVGKTELARSIAATYFGAETNMIRLDMTEYQQAEDANRLLENGSKENMSLLMAMREQPFCVVLLDEIEKSHPNVLNLLLQMLDEGQLTDESGRPTSFKDAIIIATSNAGANEIRERIARGDTLEKFEAEFIDGLISSNQFKPELLNRFDEIVLFRPLKPEELAQVVHLMLGEVNKNLEPQNITVDLTSKAVAKIVEIGYDARLGARPMRRALQRSVEDAIANKILKGLVKPGQHIVMDVADLELNAHA